MLFHTEAVVSGRLHSSKTGSCHGEAAHSYLVNTRKVLDEEAQKNPSNHPTSHLQDPPEEVVPSGAWKDQQRKFANDTIHCIYCQKDV